MSQGIFAPSLAALNVKILLVEDNAINCEIAVGILEDFGCQVITAENGEQAIAQLNTINDIGLVLMNCQMPIMDGYEATQCKCLNSWLIRFPLETN